MKRTVKVWGEEVELVNTSLYCLKILVLQPGFQSSLHYHKIKDETFVVDRGEVYLEIHRGEEQGIRHYIAGNQVHIPPGMIHRFWTETGASVLEVSTHHDDKDVYRLEESCCRSVLGSAMTKQ